ncbi:MAG: GGDEF domain-containing protein [Pseudomonadota bacterium]
MRFRRHHIWLVATAFTIFTTLVGAVACLIFYEADQLVFELLITSALTIGLTFPLTAAMGHFIFRNSELNAELRRIVSRDRLTDAATRDYFFDQMEENNEAYGVSLVVDIDHFKKVNDTYGHLAGDGVIKHVADILRENCAPNDIVCRFGGEEFVVFLDGAEPGRGARIADRILRQAEEAKIFEDNRQIKITVSIGGSLKAAAADIEDCIREADEALYLAKSSGRNRAIMAWAPQAG